MEAWQGVGHDVNMQGNAREQNAEQAATTIRSFYAAPRSPLLTS